MYVCKYIYTYVRKELDGAGSTIWGVRIHVICRGEEEDAKVGLAPSLMQSRLEAKCEVQWFAAINKTEISGQSQLVSHFLRTTGTMTQFLKSSRVSKLAYGTRQERELSHLELLAGFGIYLFS